MRRLYLALALVLSGLTANAQHDLQLDGGAGNYGIFEGSALPLGVTIFTLPPIGGTILVDPPAGPAMAWKTLGNGFTTPGTHFLGTTDNVAFHINVRNGATINNSLIFSTNGSISREISGVTAGNARGTRAVDLQQSRTAATQVASGNWSTIGGGAQNIASAERATVGGGAFNTASGFAATVAGGNVNNATGDYSFAVGTTNTSSGFAASVSGGWNNIANNGNSTVGGGVNNTASGFTSVVAGGGGNQATNDFSTVSGGNANTASGARSTIGGGLSNGATTDYATVAGGNANQASGQYSFIGGGQTNTASGNHSTVSGGQGNIANNQFAMVLGGAGNTASGYASTVGGSSNTASGGNAVVAGGEHSTATNGWATVSGGNFNHATAVGSVVSGGLLNTAAGDNSAIIGGRGLTLDASADNSFGFNANAAANAMTISSANTAVFGNTNMWLANNTNAASELRFYEANATASGAFPPAGINYTAFKAGAQAADLTYTLPTAYPTSNGQVLASTTAGAMSWISPGVAQPLIMYQDGVTEVITADNQVVNVGNRSYINMDRSGAGGVTSYTVTLSAGTTGQMLIIRGSSANDFEIDNNTGTNNTKVTGSHHMNTDDVIMLVYTGSYWLEISHINY